MSETDRSVATIGADLLVCLATEVAKVPTPPASVSLRTGVIVELLLSMSRDECCEGVAWLRLVQMYPSSSFPDPDRTYSPCGPLQWAVVYELGVARCAPRPAANDLPSADQWNEVSLAVLDDAAAMRRAMCCWADSDPDRMYVPGLWTPLPTEGGCVGGTQQLTVAAGACDCEPEEEPTPAVDAFVAVGAVAAGATVQG